MESITDPQEGESYYIGPAPPYEVVTWAGGQWIHGGTLQGPAGEDGRGLASLVIDDRGQLHAVYTDGTVQELMARGIRYVIRERYREAGKPGYGLGDGPVKVVLETGDLTGTAEISLLVSGREYDAENMGFYGDDLPNGTIFIKKTEE